MKRTIFPFLISIVALSLFAGVLCAQDKKDDIRTKTDQQLIQDFLSNDWGSKVAPAEKELESRQTKIIPEILALLNRDDQVKLKNTWDLIYPGAEKFYGHGWVLDYDVDWISVRAGWLLEELTFQDFGFREGVVDHDEILLTVIKGKSDSYISDLKKKLKGQDVKKQTRTLAAEKVREWWRGNNGSWNRLDAVVRGLQSSDVPMQGRIFQWLRNGHTKCDGLNLATFDRLILPVVKKLLKSGDKEIREEAKLLIESNSKEKWWYRNKLERDFPDTYNSMELKE